jgi:DNA-binding MarR family transcriptional regulator
VNITGTVLILLAILVIFLIVTDPRFVDHCKAFGEWLKGLFTRNGKKKNDDEVTIDLPVDTETHEPEETNDAKEGNEVTFTIEQLDQPEQKTEGQEETDGFEIEIEEPVPEPEQEPLPDDGGPTDGSLTELLEQESKQESSDTPESPDLEIEDVRVFVAVWLTEGTPTLRGIADLAGMKQVAVVASLQKLVRKRYLGFDTETLMENARDLVSSGDDGSAEQPLHGLRLGSKSERIVASVERVADDFEAVCARGLSEEECAQARTILGKVVGNVRELLS